MEMQNSPISDEMFDKAMAVLKRINAEEASNIAAVAPDAPEDDVDAIEGEFSIKRAAALAEMGIAHDVWVAELIDRIAAK